MQPVPLTLNPTGSPVKLVVDLRKGRAGVGWCKFLVAVTNTVIALLRNKGENMPFGAEFLPLLLIFSIPAGALLFPPSLSLQLLTTPICPNNPQASLSWFLPP